ncbi:MAG: terpene cyclase/mutase family protein [Planctomycetales bacterium]|nr:terpene cyclase/mutase family protein [Planctomycetales bacterium]
MRLALPEGTPAVKRTLAFVSLFGILFAAAASAAEPANGYDQVVARAVNFLKTKGQRNDGSYEPQGIGVTAIVTTAVLRHGRTPEDPLVAKSLEYLLKHIRPDGGIYSEGSNYKNYETCLTMLCLAEANKSGRYESVIKKADAFVKSIQWDETEEKDLSDPAFGGAGYGSHKRPDLSNTSFLIEALRAAGNDADDKAIQRALIFVSRSQNLESEFNTTPFPAKVNDGGFYYTPAAGGSSQAGNTENGGLRSYASMTYAGLKSMIYAGVDKDDPRVKAAVTWIKKHYDLDANPGMGAAGLYYYYHTFAKALSAMGVDQFEDESGKAHDWRQELIAELASRQQVDGSWINDENERWREGDANLATGYALLALSYCRK